MLTLNYATLVRDLTKAIVPKRLDRTSRTLVFLCLLITASTANALVQPIFGSSQGPTLLVGSNPNLTEGAKYIYQNVATSTDGIVIDAIVTIVELNDIAIIGATIDSTLGEEDRFEPLTNTSDDDGYVEWKVEFVQDGTVTNATDTGVPAYMDSFTLEAIDVDGEEFFEAIVTSSYTLEDSPSQPTDLTVSTNGAYTKFQSGSESVNPISAADTQFIVRINYQNVHTISFRNGSEDENDSDDNRQNSIGFTGEVTFNTEINTELNVAPTVVANTGNTIEVDTPFNVNLLTGASDADGNIDLTSTQLFDPGDLTNQGSVGNPLVITGVGTYTVDASGNLSFTPVIGHLGPASILFNVSDTLGVSSDRASLGLTVGDSTPPVVVIVSAPTATLVNQTAFPVSGTCSAGDGDVTVSIAGATPPSQAVTCSAGGIWSASFDVSAIGDGPNVIDVNASQTDAAGNIGNALQVEASKDAAAPVVATTSAPIASLLNQAAYPVGGTCTAGDGDVTVSIAGATPPSQAVTCSAGGTWIASFNVSAIGDGPDVIDINASQTDAAGNIGNALLVEADKNTIPPLVAINSAPTATLDNQATYPVSGTCTAGDGNVTVSIAGATPLSQAVTCSAGGTWIASFNVSAIGDGSNVIDINASQTDVAGNIGNAVPVTADKDTVSVTVAILNAPAMTVAPFNVTFEFSTDVTGFTIGDIVVGNGSASNFFIVDGNTYTAVITPDGNGDITIDIAADAAQDASSNGNLAAVQVIVILVTDADGDGIPDNAECPAGPPFDASCPDSDGDGIPDFQDPDSDNDGIPDDVEVGSDPNNPVDTDGDGVPDYLDQDSDNDGLPDSMEGGPSAIDTDGDGIPDILENGSISMDSDNDGIDDALDVDQTGGADANGDGIDDNVIDRDGDGVSNYLDLDSDNDGIPDMLESGSSGQDVNGNDIDDAFDFHLVGGIDANMDGIVDTLLDTDGDASSDQFDLDADADCNPGYR